jgi:hypothetical protein
VQVVLFSVIALALFSVIATHRYIGQVALFYVIARPYFRLSNTKAASAVVTRPLRLRSEQALVLKIAPTVKRTDASLDARRGEL